MINNFKQIVLKATKQETKEERISVEIVYIPDERDTHQQYMTAETIRKACEDFNSNLAAGKISANLYHISNTDKFEIIKSWINEVDMVSVTGEAVKEGTWLVKLRYSPELWDQKKKGKICGVSIGCRGVVDQQTGEISQVSFSPD